MPAKSRAQLRLMYAAARGKTRKGGPSPEVAREFINATGNAKKLPERKTRKGK